MQVEKMMTRRVFVTTPGTPLDAAWRMMQMGGVRHLPVIEDGELVGMLSDRDVLRASQPSANGIDVPPLAVEHAMSPLAVTVRAEARVSEAVDLLLSYKIDALPVVDAKRRLQGMVTTTDMLELLRLHTDSDEAALPFTYALVTP